MKHAHKFCILLGLLVALSANAQPFAKIFTFQQSNPFYNTSFNTCHELSNSGGYLVLADRYTTYRSAMLIKTDTLLNEIWSTALDFQNAAAPYDNINFFDVGELLNGNYFVFGMTGTTNEPYYVVFLFDTAGNVIDHVSVHETQVSSQVGNYPQIHIGIDSSIIIGFSEYNRYGFYRLDQNLNVLSSGFYYNGPDSWGRDCIMLHDTTLLITSAYGLTRCTANGTVLWSKEYNSGHHFMSAYESPTGSIYVSGISTVNGFSSATLGKYDANGNPVFLHHFSMNNVSSSSVCNTSGIWNIYPDGNNLMLYSDSVMFVVDTNGYVLGFGRTLNAYNYKYLKPTHNQDFIVSGLLFQDSIGWYAYTMIRFNDTSSSGCLHLRNVTAIPDVPVSQNFSPLIAHNEIVVADTFAFNVVHVNLDFDVLNGCPPNPLGLGPEQEQHAFTLYPNPGDDKINLQNLDPGEKIVIVNSLGQQVYTATAARSTQEVPVESWAEGIYFVSLPDRIQPQALMFAVTH